jgi:hypothetical protein
MMAAARELLPLWIGWMPLVSYPAASFLLTWLAGRVAEEPALAPLRRYDGPFWAERARLAYPARAVYETMLLLLPIFFGGLALTVGPMSRVSASTLAVTSGVAAYFAAGLTGGRFLVEMSGIPPGEGRWRRFAAQSLVRAPHLIVGLGVAVLMPAELSPDAWVVAAGGLLALHRVVRGDSLRLARRFGLIRPASWRLEAIVGRACEQVRRPALPAVELPCRYAYVVVWPTPPTLIVSDRTLEILNDEEAAALCANAIGRPGPREPSAARAETLIWVLLLAAARPLIGTVGFGPYLALLAPALIFCFRRKLFVYPEEPFDAEHRRRSRAQDPGVGGRQGL